MNVSLEREGPEAIQWVALSARLARPFWGITGLVAVACGGLASGWSMWDGASLARLFLAWLLADLAWGTVWDLLVGSSWSLRPPEQRSGRMAALPYTQPGSVSYRLFRVWHGLRRGWGGRVVAVFLASAVAAGLTALLSVSLWPLTAAALALSLAAALVRRHEGYPSPGGQAVLTLGLPWLAGHVALAPLTVASLVGAGAGSLALWGYLRIGTLGRQPDVERRAPSGGLLRVIVGQVALGGAAAWARQPWLAAGVLALLLPALALWPGLAQEVPPDRWGAVCNWYVRWAGVGLLAALPLAALALGG